MIEFFDEPEVAEAAIHLLDDLVPGGHIVSWLAKRYGPAACLQSEAERLAAAPEIWGEAPQLTAVSPCVHPQRR